MDILAVIPAKSVSKRLPNKNFLFFNNEPLVLRAVKVALAAGVKDVIVSTDMDKKEFYKIIPDKSVNVVKRPKELCEDSVDSDKVALYHAGQNKDYGAILLLQPTSPLLDAGTLKRAISFFVNNRISALVSSNSEARFSGAFAIVETKALLKEKTIFVSGLWVMPGSFGDIDDISDFRILEGVEKGRVVK